MSTRYGGEAGPQHAGLTVGLVVVMAIGVGIVVAVPDNPRPDARADNPPGPSGSAARQPSPTPPPTPPSTPPSERLLLPNMRSLRPSDLAIEVVGDERRLRFAASLANLGPGPLRLLPRVARAAHEGNMPPSRPHRAATPTACPRRVATAPTTGAVAACSATRRRHWHFPGRLLPAPSWHRQSFGLLEQGQFSLRDNRRVPGQRVVVRREHFGRCSRNSQQGISPGWVDVQADLDGQWPRLPRSVNEEVVCLDLKADPRGRLTETDEADNATTVALRIDGSRVRRVNSAPCR